MVGNIKGGMSWSGGSSSSGSLLLEHVDLQQTMTELVQHAEPGLLLLDCSNGQSSSSRHVGLLVVLHGPSCCMPLNFLNGVVAADGVGVSYRTGELKEGSHKSFVGCCFHHVAVDTQVPSDKALGLICPAGDVGKVQVPSQVTRDPYSKVFGTGDFLQKVAL